MKKFLIGIIAFVLIIGGYVISRPADYTMKPAKMNAAEISEEMPEILFTECDQAMESHVLADPDFSAAIASSPTDNTSLFQYPLEEANLLLSDWLDSGWKLTDLSYGSNVIIISVTMDETKNLAYQFSVNESGGSYKCIGVYDTEKPFPNTLALYLNDNGQISKEIRTRVWF